MSRKKQRDDVISVDNVCLVCALPLNICICERKVKVVQNDFIYRRNMKSPNERR